MNDQFVSVVVPVVIALAVIVVVLYRQLRVQRLHRGIARMPLILAVVGVAQMVDYVHRGGAVTVEGVAGVALGLIAAAALAWPRAQSMKVWQDADGEWWGRGTWMSVVLWCVTIGTHLGITLLASLAAGTLAAGNPLTSGLEGSSFLLYLGVSLGCQAWFRGRRTVATASQRVRETADLR